MLEYHKIKLIDQAISSEEKSLQIFNVSPYGLLKTMWYGNRAQVGIQS